MRLPTAAPRAPDGSGERLLAWAEASTAGSSPTRIGGSRRACFLPHRVPWQQVSSAVWDGDAEVLRVVEMGTWGEVRPTYEFSLEPQAADRLLRLFRERITSTVVLQRHVAVAGKRGARIIARRPSDGALADVVWFVEYDEGIDPSAAPVQLAVEETLHVARSDLGVS